MSHEKARVKKAKQWAQGYFLLNDLPDDTQYPVLLQAAYALELIKGNLHETLADMVDGRPPKKTSYADLNPRITRLEKLYDAINAQVTAKHPGERGDVTTIEARLSRYGCNSPGLFLTGLCSRSPECKRCLQDMTQGAPPEPNRRTIVDCDSVPLAVGDWYVILENGERRQLARITADGMLESTDGGIIQPSKVRRVKGQDVTTIKTDENGFRYIDVKAGYGFGEGRSCRNCPNYDRRGSDHPCVDCSAIDPVLTRYYNVSQPAPDRNPKPAARVGDLMIYRNIVAEITELCPDGQYARGVHVGSAQPCHWDLGRVILYRRAQEGERGHSHDPPHRSNPTPRLCRPRDGWLGHIGGGRGSWKA